MTFHKYLVTFGLLAAGLSPALAADDTAGSSASTANASSTTTHKSTHHRRHHAAKSESAAAKSGTSSASTTATTTSPSASTKADASSTRAASAEAGTNSHTSSRRHHHKGAAKEKSPTKEEGTTSTASAEKNPTTSAPASTNAVATGTVAASATTEKQTSSHHRHHGKTTESAAPTAGATSETAATKSAGAAGTPAPNAAVAPGVVTIAPAITSPATTTTSTRHRRHHGKTTTEPVVGTHSVSPLPSPSSSAAVLPATPPGMPPAASVNAVPTVETSLPVARPGSGTTAMLPLGAGHSTIATPFTKFPFTDYPAITPHRPTRTYPWKTGIITTVFWIGEGGSTLSSTTNHASSWDMQWTYHNGGVDDPDEMSKKSGYSFDTHASTLNPFYIALPFNDLAYPDKAQRWLPPGWYKPPRHGQKPVSACQGRWVEIKNRAGRVCYAQWEDVGPLVSDHAEYVFGPERPTTLTRAGLDVSPAVAKYLGFDSTALTSWRFVDDADVQPGMWLRYDEQAILFRALKEQMRPNSSPRMQDLAEPMPDGSSQDDSEKRAGAARG